MAKSWLKPKDEDDGWDEAPPPTPPIPRPLPGPADGEEPPEPPGPVRMCGDMQ